MRQVNPVGLFFAVSIFIVLAVATGCGPTTVKPDLYLNEHLRQVGNEQLERDIAECNDLAATYVKHSGKYDELARDTAKGAVIGSAAGALGGVIMGDNVGRALAAGAAAGAINPLLQQVFSSGEPSPNREKFVEYCLADRGYQVL
jgi:outer membrane lipoprotein SlyB